MLCCNSDSATAKSDEKYVYDGRIYMYDAAIGSCSRDPIGYWGSKWNLPEYVDQNPLNKLDLLGKTPGIEGLVDMLGDVVQTNVFVPKARRNVERKKEIAKRI